MKKNKIIPHNSIIFILLPREKLAQAIFNPGLYGLWLCLAVVFLIIGFSLYALRLLKRCKMADASLRKFFQAVEQSKTSLVITDTSGNIEYVNPRFSELTGYTPQEVIGENPRIFKSDGTSSASYAQLWETISQGKDWQGEFHNQKKNGQRYWVSASISSVKNQAGVIEHYFEVAEDITQRKRIEEELGRVYKMMHGILENAPLGIYVVNNQGGIDYVNKAMLNISGATYDQFKNLNVLSLPTYKRIGLDEKIRLVLNEDNCFSMESVEYASYFSNRVTVRNFSGMPLVEDGVKKALIFVEDITQQKRLERMKDEFVSNVSHELRTPLSIIKEGISLVLDKIPGEVNEKQKTILATSKNNIDRLTRIVDELLDISKIEAGKVELKKTELDLVDLVKHIAKTFALTLDNARLKLELKFASPKIIVFADADKLTQIFVNLLSNAIKFTKKGRIEVSLAEHNQEVECAVKDTGIGIAAEDLDKLFNKFQQFGRAKASPGTGLGLSITKGLIQMHNGRISAKSKLGEGTVITFVLPKSSEVFP